MRLYGTSKDTPQLPGMSARALNYLTSEADNLAMAVRDFSGSNLLVGDSVGAHEHFVTADGDFFRLRR